MGSVLLAAGVAWAGRREKPATPVAASATPGAKRAWSYYHLDVLQFTKDPTEASTHFKYEILPRRGETEAQHEARADAKKAELLEMIRQQNALRPAGANELQIRIHGRHITLDGEPRYER